MAMRNPSTLLYMNINKNLNKEEPIKNNNKGLLTRDARKVERKKPGQPGARKNFQFSKR